MLSEILYNKRAEQEREFLPGSNHNDLLAKGNVMADSQPSLSGSLPQFPDPDFNARFWAKVNMAGPDDCWEWMGYRLRGYGHCDNRYGTILTHRLVCLLVNGIAIHEAAALDVCHRCDNPPCCNPKHLFVGTRADNMRDSVAKRRIALGERNASAKLTVEKVLRIHQLFRQGMRIIDITKTIGGISRFSVMRVVNGQAWTHVEARQALAQLDSDSPAKGGE